MRLIRSTRHAIHWANAVKLTALDHFILEYRRAAKIYLDFLWDYFDIDRNHLDLPKYIDYKIVKFDTPLSARALNSCADQVLGVIGSVTEKQRRRLFKVHELLRLGIQPSRSLINKIRQHKPTKPRVDNLKPELSSNCVDFKETAGEFNAYLRIKSIGKTFGHIKLPIKYHRRSNYWRGRSKRLNSFLIDRGHIEIRWELPKKTKTTGATVGADQGVNTLLTLSNGSTTPDTDIHGHSLHSILDTLARRKKGSKSFNRAQIQRDNFIRWSINQLNFDTVKQVNLEKIWNIGYKRRQSRKLSHWTNSLIRDKLIRSCEEQEVLVIQQTSAYRSQRCSQCGLVRSANRKGKQYICKGCGLKIDSDLNAALNHEQNLYYLGWEQRRHIKANKLNLGSGFYWQSNGFFNAAGEELRVPLTTNEGSNI